jgi:hypothetical protein
VAHRKLAIFRRRVFTAVSVLSLLLCLATVALWVRSYWRGDFLTCFGSGAYRQFASCRGQLYMQTGPTSLPDGHQWRTGGPYYFFLDGAPTTHYRFLGFEQMSGMIWNGAPGRRFSVLVVPYWLFALVLAATPMFRLLRRPRPVPGLCPNCGYDLRATPERCPECGTERVLATDGARIHTD